jgi:glycerol-3-phosphate cytidylyltransferase
MESEIVVYTGGTFDLFHNGHVELLEYCAFFGDKVVVSLNTDEFVEEFKGKPPIMSFKERRDILLSTKYVDDVIPNHGGKDSKPAILKVQPDIIVIGMDWLEKDYCKQMDFTSLWLSKHKITLCYVPRTRGVSTTSLKRRI